MRSSSATRPDLAGHLRHAILRVARRMRQEAGSGLSPSLTAALVTIEQHGPLTPSELASRERIQRPTATRILARLEEARLVERTADLYDRRSSLVAITQAGRDLLEEQRTRKTAFLASRIERLEPDERATLEQAADILERVLER